MAKTWCKRVKVVFADDATIFFLQDAFFQMDCEIFVCLSFFSAKSATFCIES